MIQVKRNLTPQALQCGPVLGCPAVYELTDGSLLVIGRTVSRDELPEEVRRKIAGNEVSVIISKELLGGCVE